ncbi:MAG: hypothetical protein DMG69_00515 [Acidobacteria bacterium]|nr:MAG: hypothetical protein DMG69_00515 [Acidobacteriota bacterium]
MQSILQRTDDNLCVVRATGRELITPEGIKAVARGRLIGKASGIAAVGIAKVHVLGRIDFPCECRSQVIRTAGVLHIIEALRRCMLIVNRLRQVVRSG